jgi:hypothetical protein
MNPTDTLPMNIPFEDWPLHDAVLHELRVDWSGRTCTIYVRAFLSPEREAEPCRIRCSSLRSITVPHRAPWGESLHINGQRRAPDGRYLIEVQSGDVIEIDAELLELLPGGELKRSDER